MSAAASYSPRASRSAPRTSGSDDHDRTMDTYVTESINEVLDRVELELPPHSLRQSGAERAPRSTGADTVNARLDSTQDGEEALYEGSGDLFAQIDAGALDLTTNPAAATRFNRARLQGLAAEVTELKAQLQERERQLAAVESDLPVLRKEKTVLAAAQRAHEAQLDKLQRANEDLKSQLGAKENAVRDLSRDANRVAKDKKQQMASQQAAGVRLQRALEEAQRWKAVAHQAQHGRTTATPGTELPVDAAQLLAENKRLERQRTELIAVVKKQSKLVDVLKRQRLHLEAAQLVGISQAEMIAALPAGRQTS